MANEKELSEAKQWCDEARKLLKTQKYGKDATKELEQRIKKILSELKALDKGVQSGKFGLLAQDVTAFVLRFLSMSAALNEAARTKDLKEVERQSLRMSELKKELALATATSKGGKKKAQEKLDERAQGNLEINAYIEAREAAYARVSLLRVHAQAAAIDGDLDAVERDLIEGAADKADAGDYPAAMRLLNGVAAACDKAEQLADDCGDVEARVFQVQSMLATWRQHAQAPAGEVEFAQVDQKLREAGQLADVTVRDYAAALSRLDEGEVLGRAGTLKSDQCQQAIDARVPAAADFLALGDHPQAEAIEPEISELGRQLQAADGMASLAQRQYLEAVAAYGKIVEAAAKAVKLADECVDYNEDLARVQGHIDQCGRHAQAAAVEVELTSAAEKIGEAAKLAAAGTRDYKAALFSLQQAYELGDKALELAAHCQRAVDAAVRPRALVLSLAQLRKRFESVAKQLQVLEPKLSQADEKASKAQRDYNGAIALYEQIEKVAGVAQGQADKGVWEQSQAKIQQLLQAALEVNPPERTRLEALWMLANEQADDNNHGAALKTLATLRQLATAALSAKPDQEKGQSVEKLGAKLSEDIELTVTLGQAQDFLNGELAEALALAKAFGNNPPAAWKLETDRIADSLKLEREAGLSAVKTALEQAKKDLAKHVEAINKLGQERKDWLSRWQYYDAQFQSLIKHNGFNGAPTLTGRRGTNQTAALQAKTLTDTHDYAGALLALAPCIVEVDALRVQADASTAYKVLRSRRAGEITAAPPSADQEAIDARAAANQCLTDAGLAATAGRYSDAMTQLDAITQHLAKISLVVSARASYDLYHGLFVAGTFASYDAEPAKYKDLIKLELDPMRKLKTRAEQEAAANQIIKAADTISGTWMLSEGIKAILPSVKDYVDDRAIFDIEYQKVETHAGREGIKPFYERLKAQRDFADAAALKREFKAATNILRIYSPQIAPQLLVATRWATYKTKKDETLQKIEEIKKKPDAGLAGAELAACQAYLKLAEQQAAAATALADVAPLDAATTALDQALAQAKAGEELAKKTQELEKKKAAAGGSELDTLKARVTAFADMKCYVAAQTSGGTFDSLLSAAELKVQQADTALKLQAPDTGTAGPLLDQAEQALKDILLKAARKGPYDTLLGQVDPEIKTTLPGLNVAPDDCLKDELQKLGELLTKAKDDAKAPGLDFAAGFSKLTEAQVLIGRAKDKHGEFVALKTDRQVIKDMIVDIDKPEYQPALVAELNRLKKFETDIDKQLAAFNFAAARKLVADGKALQAGYDTLRDNYTKVTTRRTNVFNDADGKLPGKPACKTENDEYQALKPRIDTLIDTDRSFAGADKLLTRVEQLVWLGNEEVTLAQDFVNARGVVAGRLPGAKVDSNDGVKDLIAQVETELTRADESSARREHVQAKQILEPLTALLDKIDTDKPLYAAYATALELANQRLLACTTHAQAEFILPLVGLADVKRLQAMAACNRRDFTGAKALADQAASALQDALNAANGHTQFEGLASGADAGNAQVLEAAATNIDDKIKVLAGEPTAHQLPGKMAEARTKLKAAREFLKAGDLAKAAPLLREAGLAANAAEMHKLQWTQINEQQTLARQLVAGFTGPSQRAKDFVATRLVDIGLRIEAATQTMISRGSTAASEQLAKALEDFHKASRLAERYEAYVVERLKLVPASGPSVLEGFERHNNRFSAAEDIETLRQKLAEAATAAEAPEPDFDLAMRALNEADAAAAAGRLALDMVTKAKAPKAEDIAKVLAQPGGPDKLDKIVKNVDPAQRRVVLQRAFEIRFGCDLKFFKGGTENQGKNFGVDVAHFYENFKKLPPKHTTKNDLLMHVEDRRGSADDKKGEGGSSDYAGWYRKMTMRDGSSATSAGRDLGAKHALGKVVDPYKPANEDPVLFLDWNTVHEAGHAVDEKYRFMASRAGQEAFGGWTEYGMDTARVAAKLKDEFEYDLRYITELLAGDPAPLIPDPSDDSISFDVWEQRRQRLHLWYENAQADKNPWETEATARALELKSGEIIHDAYGNFWCGYLASARAKGITGYQFRSPLEWFSEIYAAKYLGKLQPTHPASLWLDSLAIAEAPKR